MPTPPPLPTDDRQHLEDAYRQAVGTVRALARAMGKPDPFKTRAERQAERLSDLLRPPVEDFPPIADT